MARTAEHKIDEERKRSSVETEHGAEAGELSVGKTLWDAHCKHSQAGERVIEQVAAPMGYMKKRDAV